MSTMKLSGLLRNVMSVYGFITDIMDNMYVLYIYLEQNDRRILNGIFNEKELPINTNTLRSESNRWLLLANNVSRRCLSSQPDLKQSKGEQHISSILKDTVNPSYLEVRDISGGCGSMYEILIQSDNFKGKSIIQQHRMVKEALAEEIKNMHGLTIRTSVPK
ncbi:BolA-like protein 3 [Trichoplax sp. H2]|nr:BolA-like protein 3 [Trichoplax sp. H2]|eukprot:RDD47601.1 BolA-like protein 3 [Trichoplax sp. H2]